MKNRMIKITALLMSVLLLGTGCGASGGDTAGDTAVKEEGTKEKAVFADTQCPTSLDLADSWNSWYTSRYGITETLFKLDDTLTAQPFLAESCEMQDDTTWVIKLRDDVTFQNGKKMTAETVKKCWERTMEINARLNELLFIDSMQADGQTLTVKTTKAVPSFITSLSEPLTGIIDVEADGDIAEKPVGTGPFMPVSYEVKGTLEVEQYTDYWGGTPKLEGAVFHVIADANALAMAQQSGESDLSVSIPATSLELFEKDDAKYNVDGVAGSRGQVIFMNYDNEFIQDIHVRKAISMSIDKESYANVLNKGASVPASQLYPDFMAFGGSDGECIEYDLNGAKELLKEGGYSDSDGDGILDKDGKNISLRMVTYSTKAELPNFCEEMSSKLKEIGIDLQVEVYESVAEQQKSGDFDLMMISFTMTPTGDPGYFADIAFKTDGSSNYGHYSNTEVDALIDQLDSEFDQEKRTELTKQIQQKIIDDAGYIVVGHSKYIYVMGSSLKRLKTNPSEYYLLDAEVYIQK